MKLFFSALVACATASLAPLALAQPAAPAEDAPAAPAGQKPEDVTIVVPSGSTTTVTTTGGGTSTGAAAAPSTTDEPAVDPKKKKKKKKGHDDDDDDDDDEKSDKDEARFRGGVSGKIGAFIPNPIFQIGPEGRLGAQIDDMWAVYADFGAHGGAGAGIDTTGSNADVSVRAGGAVYVSVLGEITVEDIFFVGLGPTVLYGSFVSLDAYAGTNSGTNEAGTSVSVFAGPLPGFKFRIGLGVGSDRPSRRKQFTIAFEGNVVFGQAFDVDTDGNVASDSSGVAVGFLPFLSLGYDAK